MNGLIVAGVASIVGIAGVAGLTLATPSAGSVAAGGFSGDGHFPGAAARRPDRARAILARAALGLSTPAACIAVIGPRGAGARQARRLADAWRVPAVLVERTGGHRLAGGLR